MMNTFKTREDIANEIRFVLGLQACYSGYLMPIMKWAQNLEMAILQEADDMAMYATMISRQFAYISRMRDLGKSIVFEDK